MTAVQCEESYRRWLDRKRLETERLHAKEIMLRYRDAKGSEQRRARRQRAKEGKLANWIRQKEEDIRATKIREECNAAIAVFEDRRRRLEGERAYRRWLCASKNKPLPVPSNQGELSLRGYASRVYANPVPWQAVPDGAVYSHL